MIEGMKKLIALFLISTSLQAVEDETELLCEYIYGSEIEYEEEFISLSSFRNDSLLVYFSIENNAISFDSRIGGSGYHLIQSGRYLEFNTDISVLTDFDTPNKYIPDSKKLTGNYHTGTIDRESGTLKVTAFSIKPDLEEDNAPMRKAFTREYKCKKNNNFLF